ncbi:acetamidase/formamidase family protein [Noviherbaspirillum pedocola]|uniref:Acetamidase/formamidase family protein n=1 Tax=Noviherbaspirillum pedocola TaxID=2801341 RepID=A0A934W5U1_9BURK|nr:acetamidase/formamidase family protein [Noviherbaspirillum pedocola]MBK4735372.1 acetamidase/formamidase family protein [Noviherbaspirillum pedocola]
MNQHICTAMCTHGASPDDLADAAEALKESVQACLKEDGAAKAAPAGMPALRSEAAAPRADSATLVDEPRAHHYIPATKDTVLWGYFSRSAAPVLEVNSGDYVTIETLTHHAADDIERMVQGDPGAESVFHWDSKGKNVDRRGTGDMQHPAGAGGGLGVHICTGPVHVRNAQPGDVLEVRIIDVKPRPSANPLYRGKTYGSNAAANWGFHYGDMLTEPRQREVITIYELDASGDSHWARAVYNYRWTPQTDPFGVVHASIDYPGVPVDHSTIVKNHDVLKNVRVPVRAHFGTIGVAPAEAEMASSIPPSYTGGNIDNWRIGKGATVYYLVAVAGAMFSVGDPHASQGDAELCGTAIECSLTGTFQLILHKRADLDGTALAGLHYPLLETRDEWVVHGFSYANYLAELGEQAQSEIFQKSSLERAMRDAYRKMRHFLMTAKGLTEDEAISLMSVGVDFGVTQVVDGNWGVHALLKKMVFVS